jgi:hypothetical protein
MTYTPGSHVIFGGGLCRVSGRSAMSMDMFKATIPIIVLLITNGSDSKRGDPEIPLTTHFPAP